MRSFAALLLVLAAGCATPMTDDECRGADWYAIGRRDARFYGLQPQVDRYADQCRAFGRDVLNELYMTGWREGYSEAQGTMGGGGGGGGGSM